MQRRNFITGSCAALMAAGLPVKADSFPEGHVRPYDPKLYNPKLYNPKLTDLLSLQDVESLAKTILSPSAYAYYSGGAADEITVRWNEEKYRDIRLRQRVLIDVSKLDTGIELFGQRLASPILLSPASNQRLAHPDGELATARGAGMVSTTMVLSSGSNISIEDVVKAATQPVWFQLYVTKDRGFTKSLVQRVEAAGAKALCITVDNPVQGPRNNEQHAKLVLPPGVIHPHYIGMGAAPSKVTLDEVQPAKLTWKDMEWLQSFTKLPVLLKGIMNPLDAEIAVKMGVQGIIVSNHGGRELDTQPATIQALPGIAQRVNGRIPILVDGGIRRGTDVVKALALGASAVLIARPYLYGLSVGGAEGVAHVIKILRQELMLAMGLLGRPDIASIDRSVLWDDIK